LSKAATTVKVSPQVAQWAVFSPPQRAKHRTQQAVPALADLFEVSLDALLGRGASAPRNELAYVLRLLRDTAGESSHQVGAAMEKIREQLEELPEEFDGADALRRIGRDAWSTHLSAALAALIRLETWSEKLLRREQGRPDLSEEATMGLEEREDEAQS
jgi:hypothetical protein